MVKLCIEDDEGQQTIVPLARDEITIGRAEGNTIRLTERNVSRRHAKLVKRDGKVFVEEISARYGTRKNGEKLKQAEELREGDVVLIGDYRLSLQAGARAAAGPPNGAPVSNGSAPPGFAPPIPGAGGPPGKRPPGMRPSDGTEVLPAMPAKLVIVSSNFAGQEFPLSRKEMVVGRDETCDIVIDHRSVSGKHAKVLRDGPMSYQILDLKSKNGVRIGKERYQHVALKRGDIVELGHVKFRFVEPGENYVFSPQSILPDTPELDLPPAGGMNKTVIGVVALVVVALVVGAMVLIGGLMDTGDGKGKTGADPIAATTNTRPEVKPPANKIDAGIENARELIERGDIDKSIGVLEGLKNYSNPNPDQKTRLDELLSVARRERAFEDPFKDAKEHLADGEWFDALNDLDKIPDVSMFAERAEEQGLREQAFDGLLSKARDMESGNDYKGAKAIAAAILELEPDHPQATRLLRDMDERLQAVARAPKEPAKGDTSSPRDRDRKRPRPEARPSMSDDEKKEMLKGAMRKVASNDLDGAISDCKKLLRENISDCHRILGIAYKKKGNTPQACKSLTRAQRSQPGNTLIQKMLTDMECN